MQDRYDKAVQRFYQAAVKLLPSAGEEKSRWKESAAAPKKISLPRPDQLFSGLSFVFLRHHFPAGFFIVHRRHHLLHCLELFISQKRPHFFH